MFRFMKFFVLTSAVWKLLLTIGYEMILMVGALTTAGYEDDAVPIFCAASVRLLLRLSRTMPVEQENLVKFPEVSFCENSENFSRNFEGDCALVFSMFAFVREIAYPRVP